jgi:hypothetical protein
MARAQGRRRPTSREQARVRQRAAEAYLSVAELVLDEEADTAMPGVAAGLAVLAGIAGSDVLCAIGLGEVHRGDRHRDAVALLKVATPDGPRLATTFSRLLDIKDEAHYGVTVVPLAKARTAVKHAERLVTRAAEELAR